MSTTAAPSDSYDALSLAVHEMYGGTVNTLAVLPILFVAIFTGIGRLRTVPGPVPGQGRWTICLV